MSVTSKSARAAVLARDGYRCVECGATDGLSLDHVIPKSRGGSGEQWNLVTLCQPCNERKGSAIRVDLFPFPQHPEAARALRETP